MRPEYETELLNRLAAQQERIRQLEEILAPSTVRIPLEWKLPPSEALVFACLAARDMASRDMIHHALYSARMEDADPKVVDVFICKMRKKLERFGVSIETVWGDGYFLPDRARFAAGGA